MATNAEDPEDLAAHDEGFQAHLETLDRARRRGYGHGGHLAARKR